MSWIARARSLPSPSFCALGVNMSPGPSCIDGPVGVAAGCQVRPGHLDGPRLFLGPRAEGGGQVSRTGPPPENAEASLEPVEDEPEEPPEE
jgi:hypothetical protein